MNGRRLVITPSTDAALDLALSGAMLERVGDGGDRLVRIYRPVRAVAFSRRDRLETGFAAACEVARDAGYAAVVRGPGGRAAAYGPTSLIVEEVVPVAATSLAIGQRFDAMAETTVSALRGLELDARVGALPREYCPGDHSINVGGEVKVAGMAQRITRGAALTSMVLVVDDSTELRRVIAEVYRALGLDHDPRRTGALTDASPALSVALVERALRAQFAGDADPWEPDEALLARAAALRADYLPGPRA